jgi:hypothetical protein
VTWPWKVSRPPPLRIESNGQISGSGGNPGFGGRFRHGLLRGQRPAGASSGSRPAPPARHRRERAAVSCSFSPAAITPSALASASSVPTGSKRLRGAKAHHEGS